MMKVAVFSAHNFERDYLNKANQGKHDLTFFDARLTKETARLAEGFDAISLFTSDQADAEVLEILNGCGVRYVTLRTAGFNNVDLVKARMLQMKISRVPAYSPYAVAEHTIALMLAMNRNLIRAHQRILDANFTLDGLVGFDMHGKTVGIVGTGKIGHIVGNILHGFGCRLLAYDTFHNEEMIKELAVEYTDLDTLCRESDIITLHIPLTDETKFIIDKDKIRLMKRGVMLVNTSRGKLVKTEAVIGALKTGQVGFFGLDVYEEEEGLFFEDHSADILQDDVIARLMTFKNVLITSHQAFLTDTALTNIAVTTVQNLDCFAANTKSGNEVE